MGGITVFAGRDDSRARDGGPRLDSRAMHLRLTRIDLLVGSVGKHPAPDSLCRPLTGGMRWTGGMTAAIVYHAAVRCAWAHMEREPDAG